MPEAQRSGAVLFNRNCASCHGPAATGTEQGPPLIHPFYRSGHHSDQAFHLAVARGVPAHHWRFGDMPPVPGIERDEIDRIVAYVRWLQQEAGLE